jgi:hypothetical protein
VIYTLVRNDQCSRRVGQPGSPSALGAERCEFKSHSSDWRLEDQTFGFANLVSLTYGRLL